ncbi:MAG: DNA polymerase III subunit alpha, partial [Actinobacteria bacterium]|nr:DNA polymerase III subunit alpha [Actinomycetota bacterium]
RIDDLLARTRELGMDAVALTDHGVMFGAADFYLAARQAGVRPIIGCEVYVAPRTRRDRDATLDKKAYHLTLLARDVTGYRSLVKLVSRAQLEGFYYKPRVDRELLREHREGLVCLSGCPSSELVTTAQQVGLEAAEAVARWHADTFGEGNYYIELQRHALPGEEETNRQLRELANGMGLPVIATNDVHYPRPEQKTAHDVLLCIQTGSLVSDTDRLRMEGAYHLRAPAEMAELFGDVPEALANTVAVAARCELDLPFGRIAMPDVELPAGMTAGAHLRDLATQGLAARFGGRIPAEYQERLGYELDVIEVTDFAPYMLLVGDILRFARGRGMLTAPRGSVNGSLVAFATGMSDIDPIKHHIMFERFLTVGRKASMPDVDMDFPSDRRDEVIRYIVSKYGADHVAQIVTFGHLAARAAVRDVGRTLGMPYGDVDRVAKLIPFRAIDPFTIDSSLQNVAEVRQLYEADANVRRLLETAREVEGLARHASTHAAGLVVSREPLTEHVPLMRSTEDQPVAQFTFGTLDKIGLLKLDVLGLSNFRTITHALDLIAATTGRRIAPQEIPLDSAEAFGILRRGRTVGVFQLEGEGMTRTLRRLAPSSLDELAALIALYRPGPMRHIDDYIDTKHGRRVPAYLHPKLEPILRETHGVLVYADQVLRIVVDVAGYTWDEADRFRRAVGKKIREAMETEHLRFVERAVAHGMPEPTAEEVFRQIEPFADYGFNKAHAVSYAVIAYWTAWLKAHHPVQFLTALLETESGDTAKVARAIAEARALGIEVLPPDVNQSESTFWDHGQAIVFGLSAVKNVGEHAVAALLAARRDGGAFASLEDLCARVDMRAVPRRALESLIKVGALSALGERNHMLEGLEAALKRGRRAGADRATGQASLFESEPSGPPNAGTVDVASASDAERRRWEKELLGLQVSPSPLTEPTTRAALLDVTEAAIYALEDGHVGQTLTVGGLVAGRRGFLTRKGDPMGVITLEDPPGTIEVTVFPRLWQKVASQLSVDQVVIVTGKVEGDESGYRMVAENMYPLGVGARPGAPAAPGKTGGTAIGTAGAAGSRPPHHV